MIIPKKLRPKPQRVCDACVLNNNINDERKFAFWKHSDKCMMCEKKFDWKIRRV
jgi:hypothetical protein